MMREAQRSVETQTLIKVIIYVVSLADVSSLVTSWLISLQLLNKNILPSHFHPTAIMYLQGNFAGA